MNALTGKPRKGDYVLYDNRIVYRITGWLNSDRTIANIQDTATLRNTHIITQFGNGEFNKNLQELTADEAKEFGHICPNCLDAPCRCFDEREDD